MNDQQTAWSRQLLIAINENPAAHAALEYCGTLYKNDEDTGFHLIHCTLSAGQSVLSAPVDTNNTLLPDTALSYGKQPEKYQRLLEKCSKLLVSYGIPAGNIETSLIPAASNIHQSINMEADRTLADAIVVARRGIGYFGEMILGSVSASLFRNSPAAPLWIIDGTITNKDVLIGVDGSVHSLRAAEHVAYMLRNIHDVTVYLYHCAVYLASEVVCSLEHFYEQWDQDWCNTHLAEGGCLFNGPAQLLQEAGIEPSRIIILPETKTLDESTSIIAQAQRHKCGTIVIGRRGPSVIKGFFGGVANRTIRQTQNMAVWIVS